MNAGDKVKCISTNHSHVGNVDRIKIGQEYTIVKAQFDTTIKHNIILLADVLTNDGHQLVFNPRDFELVQNLTGSNESPEKSYDRAMGVI